MPIWLILVLGFLVIAYLLEKQEERSFYRDYDEKHKWDDFHEPH